MSNEFTKLLTISNEEKKAKGLEFTPAEIAQQPRVWLKALEDFKGKKEDIKKFMNKSGLLGSDKATLVFAGAGTSEFIGTSICVELRNELGRDVVSIPTTHFVTHPESMLVKNNKYVVVSFARSGDSPESVATYRYINKYYKNACQMVITCNKNGALAKFTAEDKNTFCILLPEETNDRSLVMTSSYSTMAMTGMALGSLDDLTTFEKDMKTTASGASRIIDIYGDLLKKMGDLPFKRACFLGSGNLFGTMQECHLKMQEMTEGRVVCRFDSFLGLRHGPQVFVNDECIVLAAVSSDPYVRQYELDLLRQLQRGKQGIATIIVCDKATDELKSITNNIIELTPDGSSIPDKLRVLTDVVAGQILALFKCMNIGLKPDNPSTSGTISRVVKGVTIYEKK